MKEILCNGKKYESLKVFAESVNLDYPVLYRLLKRGFTPEEIENKAYENKIFYNGKSYKTKKQLAKELGYNNTHSKEFSRISLEIAPPKRPFEINGIFFDSKLALYDALGLTCSGVRKYAVRKGLSTKEALEQLVRERL